MLQIAGTEMLYEDVKLTCMVATIPVEEESDLVSALKAELDPTCLLPADASNSFPRMVVACLDINQVNTFYSSPSSPSIFVISSRRYVCSAVLCYALLFVCGCCMPSTGKLLSWKRFSMALQCG